MKTKLLSDSVDFWLKNEYPLTVVADRYGGCYSGGNYLAFPRDFCDIEEEVCGSDPECMVYWGEFDDIVGRGATIEDAVGDLRRQMQEEKNCGYQHCQTWEDILNANRL